MKKLFLLLAVVIAATMGAMAQSRTIHGVVIDADTDEPLIGASVLPVGSSSGVATDLDGRFTLTIPDNIKQIKVTYIGMQPLTVNVSDNMTISLQKASNRLDEIVVTGYGSGKKLGSVVGSVSVVGEAALENTPTSNVVDALQGQVAGLDIFSNTGEPAQTPTNIRIRGVNSLNADNTPLFILDGAPVTSAVLTSINVNDIENVTVLKDASATAIYGSRAANGVIVITTKKGRFGEDAKVTVRANVGWSERVQSRMEMMNSKQYLEFRETQAQAFGVQDLSDFEKDLINVYGIDTNWRDVMMKDNALTYSMEAAVQGGGERSNYFLSLGHFDQDGLVAKSGFRRESLRAAFDIRAKEWLRLGFQANLGVEHYETNSVAAYAGNFYLNGPIFQSYYMLPYESPYYYTFDEDGNIHFGDRADWYIYSQGGVMDSNAVADLNKGGSNQVSIMANIYQQINPCKGLTLRAQQAVDAYDSRTSSTWTAVDDYMTPMGVMTDFGQYTNRQAGESFRRRYAFTYTNTAEYNITLNNVHDITALIGQESIITRYNAFGVSTNNQPNNIQMMLTNGTDITMENVSQSIWEYIVNSYFLQLNYSFDNRYFLDFTLRRDGSSKFADGHRWATFFAIGAMWNIKNEKFLAPISWIDDLKLRVNYGTTGNSGIDPYMYIGTIGTGTSYDGESSIGLASQSNDDLTWETVRQFSTGVSFGFLDRLYGTADFYVKNTENMLMKLPYSYTTGWSAGMSNIGSMRNIGVDVEIGSHIIRTPDWYWGVRVNFNYNKNTITELFNGRDEYVLADYGLVYKVGEDPNQLNSVPFLGVDPADGKPIWQDINGNPTKVFNSERDAVNLGKSYVAPWTGGFGTDLRWRDLALRVDFNWAADKYIFNWADQQMMNPQSMYQANMSVKMLNAWTTPGQITDVPAITNAIQPDSRYVQNSSFVRMKNITLTYNLPKNLISKIDLSNVAFHFTGRNLLTFFADGYTGNDPEYENNGVRFSYPNTRQYEFGIEVSF